MGRMSDLAIEIEELNDKLKMQIEEQEAALRSIMAELESSEKENERLRKLYLCATDPKIAALELEPGGSLRIDLEPCLGAKMIAASFADMLGDAENWRCVEIGPFGSDNGTIVVTARRYDGKLPEYQLAEAKEEIEKLKAEINELEKDRRLGIFMVDWDSIMSEEF